MQNHMRETIDQGLGELQKKEGQDGIPAAPPEANAPPVQPMFAEIAPPPDPNVATELSQQSTDGNQAEQEALSQTVGSANPAPVAPPKTLALGQTTAEVVAILGQPGTIADLGVKIIYFYPKAKVTFLNGKVSDIQ